MSFKYNIPVSGKNAVSDNDFVTLKQLRESLLLASDVDKECKVATTYNINGVYSKIDNNYVLVTNTLSIDGVELEVGDNVLLKNQENKNENGIYYVSEKDVNLTLIKYNNMLFKSNCFVRISDGVDNKDLWYSSILLSYSAEDYLNSSIDYIPFPNIKVDENTAIIKQFEITTDGINSEYTIKHDLNTKIITVNTFINDISVLLGIKIIDNNNIKIFANKTFDENIKIIVNITARIQGT